MAEVGVVHLVRARNGLEPFQRFLASYAPGRTAMPHRLLLVFKGFSNEQELRPYRELALPFDPEVMRIDDAGFDLDAYHAAARSFALEYLCFVNSFSTVLDPEWLVKLYRALTAPGIGVVGATGSWESWRPGEADWTAIRTKPLLRRVTGTLRLMQATARYAPFPNYHLRTNAFMLRRDLALRLSGMKTRAKEEAWRFESGKNSLTCQILHLGLLPLVVGRDGHGYSREEWHRSNTFRQGDQGNLLVADNRTRHYEEADPDLRQALWRHTWREQALPPTLPERHYEGCLS